MITLKLTINLSVRILINSAWKYIERLPAESFLMNTHYFLNFLNCLILGFAISNTSKKIIMKAHYHFKLREYTCLSTWWVKLIINWIINELLLERGYVITLSPHDRPTNIASIHEYDFVLIIIIVGNDLSTTWASIDLFAHT
jgi:hypothetical protein